MFNRIHTVVFDLVGALTKHYKKTVDFPNGLILSYLSYDDDTPMTILILLTFINCEQRFGFVRANVIFRSTFVGGLISARTKRFNT